MRNTPSVTTGFLRWTIAVAFLALAAPSFGTAPTASHRPQVGGEDFGSAVVIPGLPFTDTGNTCPFVDDVETPLECGLATGPDVVYKYTPIADQCIRIRLCDSQYNTMVHVYDANLTRVACNDDYYSQNFVCETRSYIGTLSLLGGQPYYIVVDGFGAACGNYELEVLECPPHCSTECPPGAIAEGEPDCGPGTPPETCQPPPSLTPLACNDLGVVVCGTFGFYTTPDSEEVRDVDGYTFTLDTPSHITICLCGPLYSYMEVGPGANFCTPPVICRASSKETEYEACCELDLGPGTYWIAVSDIYSVPCGSPYVLRIDGLNCPPVGVEGVPWTRLKSLYR